MLANEFVNLEDDMIVKHTTAGVTTGSTLGNMYATAAPTTVTNNNLTEGINFLAANQQALYLHIDPPLQHMAAMLLQAQPSLQTGMFPAPSTMPLYLLPTQ